MAGLSSGNPDVDGYDIQQAQDEIADLRARINQMAEFFYPASTSPTSASLAIPAVSAGRGPSGWDFDDGTTDGWTGNSAAVSNSTFSSGGIWPSTGANSLLIQANVGGVQWSAYSPLVLTSPGDTIYVSVDIYSVSTLNQVYVGVRYYDEGGVFISETDCSDTLIAGGAETTLYVSDTAPGIAETGASNDAHSFLVVVGSHGTEGSGTQIYADDIDIPGNLAFSTSLIQATDVNGNAMRQGNQVVGNPGMTSVDVITDPEGNVLSNVDTAGNNSGQSYNAAVDVSVAGQSILDYMGDASGGPSLNSGPLGIIAYAAMSTGSFPTSTYTSEHFVLELDVEVYATRTYRIELTNIFPNLSVNNGQADATVYFTTDGSTPGTGSTVLIEGVFLSNTNYNYPSGAGTALTRIWRPGVNALLRMRVTIRPVTGNVQLVALANADNCALTVEDIGPYLANTGQDQSGGSSGGGTQNYTNTWTCTATYSYEGNGGPNPNAKINSGAECVYGGNGNTQQSYHYQAKTWIVLPYSTIQSALSGATITSCRIYLNNNHTWYDNGGTCGIGYDTKTSFGSTASNPSGGNIDDTDVFFSEGQGKWIQFNGLGSALQGGTAYNIVLFKASSDLHYYGYMAGKNQSGPPQVKISYSK